MAKLIDLLIPFFAGVYTLLILKGVVKLPIKKQLRFDDYMRNKKKFVSVICYALIIISIFLIGMDLYLGEINF